MFALSVQSGYDKDMTENLKSLCSFNLLFYMEKWLNAPVGADDLQLWHDFNEYTRNKIRELPMQQLKQMKGTSGRRVCYFFFVLTPTFQQ